MSPIQQMLLGVGAVATKTYVDDVFSTFLYEGNETQNRSITNSIDLSGEGGLVWLKGRSVARTHLLYDTERGASKPIESSGDSAEWTNTSLGVVQFNNNGFNLGSHQSGNWDGEDFSSWTFRKAPGFFDIVTYTGTGSARTVDHNLGCVPGMIIIKRLDTADNWNVYHRSQHSSNSAGYYLQLNTADSIGGASNRWNDTAPTATQFTVGTAPVVNASGDDFVAYVFAGGSANSQALARSVSFDGSDDELYFGSTTDFEFGTGDFTWEAWIKPTSWTNNAWNTIFMVGGASQNGGLWIGQNNSNNFVVRAFSDQDILTASSKPDIGVWTHVAVARSGTTLKLFYNGIEQKSVTTSYDFQDGTTSRIANDGHNQRFTGKISNLRIVKGTAVYTSNFNPSDSLTNITNTKLLCCNDSSVTGSTVTPTTITASGGPTASAYSPDFTDVAANVFGKNKNQGIIKTGSYAGNGSSTGPEIYLGFEPSWLLIKNATGSNREWKILDSMRGLPTGSGDNVLIANTNETETGSLDNVDLTPTGFKITSNNAHYNENGERIIYCAIRRPDGYVGKPPELGTGVFAMDTGNSSSTVPCFDSGFPVDFLLQREFASQDSWITGSRHTGNTYMYTNASDAEAGGGGQGWDSNVGGGTSRGSSYQAWMWKRHAGFDVVTYTGTGAARTISHSMNAVPQMMWIKDRTTTGGGGSPWYVYHSGTADSGMGYGYLNNTDAWSSSGLGGAWNSTAPTSTAFSLGTWAGVNYSGASFIAMLFASVDGISKVGSYDGSDSAQTISLGFQPRFVIIKATNSAQNWIVLDTVRGWGSGADQFLQLDHNDSQSGLNIGAPTSTGMSLDGNVARTNDAGTSYIYYAHA